MRYQLKLGLVALLCSIAVYAHAEIDSAQSGLVKRVIVASCDRCMTAKEMREKAREWLSSDQGVEIGTVEWYSCELALAKSEALRKPVTDTDFNSWKAEFANYPVHLYAQATRLGQSLSLRILTAQGAVEVQDIEGHSLFETSSGLTLLDVRIADLRARVPVTVSLLSKPIDKAGASTLCKHFMLGAKRAADRVMCAVGADDIRPSDNAYFVRNPFHPPAKIPGSNTDLAEVYDCEGPEFSFCFAFH